MPAITPPKFDGLQVVTTGEDTIDVDVGGGFIGPQNLTTGEYFSHAWDAVLDVGPPGAGLQLMEEFSAIVNGFAGVTAVVTIDNDTGVVTVTNNEAVNTLEIRFDDHTAAGIIEVGVMLGLISIDDGAAPTIGPIAAAGGTFTGPLQVYYGWYPDVAPVDVLGDLSRVGVVRSDAVVTVPPGGRVATSKYHELTIQEFTFEYIDDALSVTLTPYTANSYEDFWRRILSTGRRWRYYPERDDLDGPLGIGPFRYEADQRTAESGTTALRRQVERETGMYRFSIGCHLAVPEP